MSTSEIDLGLSPNKRWDVSVSGLRSRGRLHRCVLRQVRFSRLQPR